MSRYNELLAKEINIQVVPNADEYGAYGFVAALGEDGEDGIKFTVAKHYVDRVLNPLDFVTLEAKKQLSHIAKLEEALGRAMEKHEFLHGYISQLVLLAARSGALTEEETEQALNPTREQFANLATKLFEIPEE